jgi:hypothetical protein
MVTGIEGARNCAARVQEQLGLPVEVAEGRKDALAMLRQKEFAAVLVDERLAECDPAAADAIWERAGLAIPLQINFAISGVARLIREIRAALRRRERERAVAQRACYEDIRFAMKDALSGLWLHSQLALAEAGVSGPAADNLRVVTDLACTLRQQLQASSKDRNVLPT